MAIEINISSVNCCICNQPMVQKRKFADTPLKGTFGTWGYVCLDTCSRYVSVVPNLPTFFEVDLSTGFAIGRKIKPQKKGQ